METAASWTAGKMIPQYSRLRLPAVAAARLVQPEGRADLDPARPDGCWPRSVALWAALACSGPRPRAGTGGSDGLLAPRLPLAVDRGCLVNPPWDADADQS